MSSEEEYDFEDSSTQQQFFSSGWEGLWQQLHSNMWVILLLLGMLGLAATGAAQWLLRRRAQRAQRGRYTAEYAELVEVTPGSTLLADPEALLVVPEVVLPNPQWPQGGPQETAGSPVWAASPNHSPSVDAPQGVAGAAAAAAVAPAFDADDAPRGGTVRSGDSEAVLDDVPLISFDPVDPPASPRDVSS